MRASLFHCADIYFTCALHYFVAQIYILHARFIISFAQIYRIISYAQIFLYVHAHLLYRISIFVMLQSLTFFVAASSVLPNARGSKAAVATVVPNQGGPEAAVQTAEPNQEGTNFTLKPGMPFCSLQC